MKLLKKLLLIALVGFFVPQGINTAAAVQVADRILAAVEEVAAPLIAASIVAISTANDFIQKNVHLFIAQSKVVPITNYILVQEALKPENITQTGQVLVQAANTVVQESPKVQQVIETVQKAQSASISTVNSIQQCAQKSTYLPLLKSISEKIKNETIQPVPLLMNTHFYKPAFIASVKSDATGLSYSLSNEDTTRMGEFYTNLYVKVGSHTYDSVRQATIDLIEKEMKQGEQDFIYLYRYGQSLEYRKIFFKQQLSNIELLKQIAGPANDIKSIKARLLINNLGEDDFFYPGLILKKQVKPHLQNILFDQNGNAKTINDKVRGQLLEAMHPYFESLYSDQYLAQIQYFADVDKFYKQESGFFLFTKEQYLKQLQEYKQQEIHNIDTIIARTEGNNGFLDNCKLFFAGMHSHSCMDAQIKNGQLFKEANLIEELCKKGDFDQAKLISSSHLLLAQKTYKSELKEIHTNNYSVLNAIYKEHHEAQFDKYGIPRCSWDDPYYYAFKFTAENVVWDKSAEFVSNAKNNLNLRKTQLANLLKYYNLKEDDLLGRHLCYILLDSNDSQKSLVQNLDFLFEHFSHLAENSSTKELQSYYSVFFKNGLLKIPHLPSNEVAAVFKMPTLINKAEYDHVRKLYTLAASISCETKEKKQIITTVLNELAASIQLREPRYLKLAKSRLEVLTGQRNILELLKIPDFTSINQQAGLKEELLSLSNDLLELIENQKIDSQSTAAITHGLNKIYENDRAKEFSWFTKKAIATIKEGHQETEFLSIFNRLAHPIAMQEKELFDELILLIPEMHCADIQDSLNKKVMHCLINGLKALDNSTLSAASRVHIINSLKSIKCVNHFAKTKQFDRAHLYLDTVTIPVIKTGTWNRKNSLFHFLLTKSNSTTSEKIVEIIAACDQKLENELPAIIDACLPDINAKDVLITGGLLLGPGFGEPNPYGGRLVGPSEPKIQNDCLPKNQLEVPENEKNTAKNQEIENIPGCNWGKQKKYPDFDQKKENEKEKAQEDTETQEEEINQDKVEPSSNDNIQESRDNEKNILDELEKIKNEIKKNKNLTITEEKELDIFFEKMQHLTKEFDIHVIQALKIYKINIYKALRNYAVEVIKELAKKIKKLDEKIKTCSDYKNFANDIAHNGKITKNSIDEALTAIASIEQGLIKNLTRSKENEYDFYEENGKKWDIKSISSKSIEGFEIFEVSEIIQSLINSYKKNSDEYLILNITYLTDVDLINFYKVLKLSISNKDLERTIIIDFLVPSRSKSSQKLINELKEI